ncbi:MAG TPA: DPP IV N-terminal domain-containing protein, partial [Aquabacterium sp.]|nr:DPP IV N-terminal domain-containing protein [Aquabacterium sp.]
LSREGGSQLYLIDTNGEGTRRLTTSNAIDTEAAWSPDGSQVYFVSDRGGGPQIYRVPVAGGNPQRVTFKGGYNISPAISPDGKWMAYVSQVGSAFVVHVMELATGEVRALTDTRDDESPSFAPNGRWLIYATRAQGRDVLMTTTLDGKIKAMLTTTLADVREPVWGPDIMARP